MLSSYSSEFIILTTTLIVGSNPNLAFYSWRINQLDSTELTIVDPEIDSTFPIQFQSSSLGSSQLKPNYFYNSIQNIPTNKKFDVIILSCNSLQDFQIICSQLSNLIDDKSIIIVESTGYINLEPFISMSLSKNSSICVMSIMNESDVRKISINKYRHQIRNNDTRIYFGTTTSTGKLNSNFNFQKFYKVLQNVQDKSNNAITLLKSSNPKEFMTYQWKLALPRIVLNPIMILFELEFPELLKNQILSKPLVTGLINELFKLIKKMDCKLVKGFENESNLLKSWCNIYPITKSNDNFINSPILFYNFYHSFNLDLDLLLLQPILLGDDNGIRTPYLENLYSVMCQYNNINQGSAIFFKRKNSNEQDPNKLIQLSNLDEEIKIKIDKQLQIDAIIQDNEKLKTKQDNEIRVQEINLKSIQQKIIDVESKLSNINYEYEKKSKSLEFEHETKFKQLNEEYNQKLKDLEINFQKQKLSGGNNHSPNNSIQPPVPPQEESRNINNGYRDSIMTQDGLSDLKHIVQYGATLNGETTQPPNQLQPPVQPQANKSTSDNNSEIFVDTQNGGDLPPHIMQKEMELRRREEALRSRERRSSNGGFQPQQFPQQQPPQQYNYNQQPYNPQQPPQQRSYFNQQPQYGPPPNNAYSDQQPPHGLPSGGLPQNQFPPPLKSNGSMTNMNKYNNPQQYPPQQMNGGYAQPQYQTQQQPPRRLSSMPGGINSFHDYQQQQQYNQQLLQQQQIPHQQYQQSNHSSFNNAAPIDPFLEGRFKSNPKKTNRRSQMPILSGNLDGFDMGGRGGMPQPGSNRKSMSLTNQLNSPPQARRSSSNPMLLNMPQQSYNQQQHPGIPQNLQSQQNLTQVNESNSTTANTHSNSNSNSNSSYLQPPNMNSSSSSTNTNDTPTTQLHDHNDDDHVQLNVPLYNNNNSTGNVNTKLNGTMNNVNGVGQPLGGIAESNTVNGEIKKKKKFFGRG
ncbi:uncharacterized protein KGF55_002548 [Candida pseudojiufengensis]|uniref:uncharacterized protein n=1 Tax=Candida pseudojiufengensis TaxID=497109 RepID=UPI002224A77A|nr:uncharacterized protein KGF55_002548 [Candida pseudojiufengensis]KAI5963668.1 hypothetical protein KGF55_002548 [Candida pseudojiufengensis]